MIKRKLGNNELQVSAIALGCMSFSGFYGPSDKNETFACLDHARNHGIDFLDTAEVYGKGLSEELIGDYQQDRSYTFKIATKGGIVVGGKRGENDNSEKGLRKALEGSLKRLKMDSVDLYYIHRRDWSIPIEEVVETLVKFKQEGKIKGFGFSEISPGSLRRAHKVHPVMAVQNEYSLWTRYPELGMIQACKELKVTFVPFSPLGRGIFGEEFPDPSQFGENDFRKNNPRFIQPNFNANCDYIARFREFCNSRGWTTSGTALAWVLDQGDHLIPIPGTRSADHLSHWGNADEIQFTDEDRNQIHRILPPGFAHGDRYSDAQIVGIERYC